MRKWTVAVGLCLAAAGLSAAGDFSIGGAELDSTLRQIHAFNEHASLIRVRSREFRIPERESFKEKIVAFVRNEFGLPKAPVAAVYVHSVKAPVGEGSDDLWVVEIEDFSISKKYHCWYHIDSYDPVSAGVSTCI